MRTPLASTTSSGPARVLVVTELKLERLAQNVHGVYQRLGTFLGALARAGVDVEVLCLNPPGDRAVGLDPQASAEVERIWQVPCRVFNGAKAPAPAPWSWTLQQLWWMTGYRRTEFFRGIDNPVNRRLLQERMASEPVLVFAHKLPVMDFLRARLSQTTPLVFDLDDVEHVAYARRLLTEKAPRDRLVGQVILRSVKNAVARAARRAEHTFVCSVSDKDLLDRSFDLPPDRVVAVPNSCEMKEPYPLVAQPVLVFVGAFGWAPNVEAADFFVQHCWDRVLQRVPDAQLLIVGRSPERIPSHGQPRPGVQFTGFVDDIEAIYRQARIVICPVQSGGGTRVKLVEAAARGKPIVSTSLGAEGLGFVDGAHVLLRDDAASFAEACGALLADDPQCTKLGHAVFAHAMAHFDRAAIQRKVRELLFVS